MADLSINHDELARLVNKLQNIGKQLKAVEQGACAKIDDFSSQMTLTPDWSTTLTGKQDEIKQELDAVKTKINKGVEESLEKIAHLANSISQFSGASQEAESAGAKAISSIESSIGEKGSSLISSMKGESPRIDFEKISKESR